MTRLTLTFDNGPTPGVTDRVLDALKARDLRATFFLVGRVLAQPGARELAQRAKEEGHWIGNHTMNHGLPLGMRDPGAPALDEIDDAQHLLGDLSEDEKYFRPNGQGSVGPHLLSPAATEHLAAHRFTVVLWSIYVSDFKNPEGWADRALTAIAEQEWGVLVSHDVASGAMADLPRLLDTVLERGVEIVQEIPDQWLPMVGGKAGQGLALINP